MGKPNPLNYDCGKEGCYLRHRKPRLEDLADGLSGKRAFTDLDGMTERNWNFLMVEWKTLSPGSVPDDQTLPEGQKRAYQRAAQSGKFITVCLAGDSTTTPMTVTHWGWWVAGEWTGWSRTGLDEVLSAIAEWDDWAAENCGWSAWQAWREMLRLRDRIDTGTKQYLETLRVMLDTMNKSFSKG